jgi:hypothetical protein
VGELCHHSLGNEEAGQLKGRLSSALSETKLFPLVTSSTFEKEDLIWNIAESMTEIATATEKILFAYEELHDRVAPRCITDKRETIKMDDMEDCEMERQTRRASYQE